MLTACPDATSSKATRHPNRRCSNPGEAQSSPDATLASSERSLVFTLAKSLERIESSASTLMSAMVIVQRVALCWMIPRGEPESPEKFLRSAGFPIRMTRWAKLGWVVAEFFAVAQG